MLIGRLTELHCEKDWRMIKQDLEELKLFLLSLSGHGRKTFAFRRRLRVDFFVSVPLYYRPSLVMKRIKGKKLRRLASESGILLLWRLNTPTQKPHKPAVGVLKWVF